MSRAVSVARVDVFTDRPFAGNPAAAVLDADGLGEAEIQAIAHEMKAPGTAFVSASPRPDADYGLRKFTPTREVAYSGHTTLGAVRALLDTGRIAGDRVMFETMQGLLPVGIERKPDGAVIAQRRSASHVIAAKRSRPLKPFSRLSMTWGCLKTS